MASEDDFEVVLTVVIGGAEDLDIYPYGYYGTYYLVGWVVEPSNWFQTIEAFGCPNPVWNQEYRTILDQSMKLDYFYVELYRTRTSSGAGPSSGNVMIGKTKISLPKINLKSDEEFVSKRSGLFSLVTPTGYLSEGKIAVKMEMKKVRIIKKS